MAAPLLLALFAMSAPKPLFVEAQHPQSKRHAVLEENAGSVYLYLTTPGEPRPERDIIVFSTQPLVSEKVALARAEAGDPPPLAKEYASDNAILNGVKLDQLALTWSKDGQAVAIIRAGKPLAMVLMGKKRGYSKALRRSGFYGEPWDEALFTKTFK
jgi:hypothetical protein